MQVGHIRRLPDAARLGSESLQLGELVPPGGHSDLEQQLRGGSSQWGAQFCISWDSRSYDLVKERKSWPSLQRGYRKTRPAHSSRSREPECPQCLGAHTVLGIELGSETLAVLVKYFIPQTLLSPICLL